jgi:hypothetical protein
MTIIQRVPRPLVAIGILTLAACLGEDPFTPQINGSMTALVDGVPFTAIATQAVRSGEDVVLGGTDAAGNTIGIGFLDIGTGTYEIMDPEPTNASYSSGGQVWSANAGQGSGTIVITTLDEASVAGTFTLTLVSTIGPVSGERQIASGGFNIAF